MTAYIEVKVPKAVLFLTPEEYRRAIQRGKAIQRRRVQAKREIEKRLRPNACK